MPERPFPIQEAIDEKSVILVESIGDLLNLHQNGFKNVLVSFGLDISKLLCHLVGLSWIKLLYLLIMIIIKVSIEELGQR